MSDNPETIDAGFDLKINGAGYVVRPCDRPLYADLVAKGFPESEIADLMAHRQAADQSEQERLDAIAEDMPPVSD